MPQYPVNVDNNNDLLRKIATNSAEIATSEAGDVASVAGTANQVLVNGGTAAATGAVTVSLPAAVVVNTSVTVPAVVASTSVLVGSSTGLLSALTVYDTAATLPRGISNVQVSSDTSSANISGYKARGSIGALATVVTGDLMMNLRGWGYDGTAYINSTSIRSVSTGTIATNRVPAQLEFYTSTDAGPSVLTRALLLDATQSATLTGNLTFGTSGSVLNGTTGSIGLTATGTNQTITIAPSGSGSLTVSSSTVNLNAAVSNRDYTWMTSGSLRWAIRTTNTAESGSNAGSGFALRAYDDTGTLIDSPISITRAAAGTMTITRPTSFSGQNITNAPSINAGASANLVLAGGSSGAILTLGQGSTTRNYNFTTVNTSLSSWTTSGAAGSLGTANKTFTNTSSSGTVTTQVIWSFTVQLMDSSSSVTVTDAAMIYIAGGPTAAGNTTITNSWALLSAGRVKISDATAASSTTSGSLVVSGGFGLAGDAYSGGIRVVSTDTLSGAGAVSITKEVTKLTSTGSAQAITLANGVDGQIKRIIHDVDGGSMVLTPTTKTGYTTITFTNAGDAVTLVYVTTRGWIVLGSFGVTIA